MIEIEVNKKKYLLSINGRVLKLLKKTKELDAFSEDLSWLDDPDILDFVGFHGIKEGCRFNGEECDLTLDKFSAALDTATSLEVQNEFLKQLTKAYKFLQDNIEKK